MPLDPLKVAVAIDSGLSAVCATCNKYWEARNRGIPGDSCLAKENCGSPLVGDDFHEYEGPLKSLREFCFVCGGKSKFGLTVRGKNRVVGVCKEHLDFVRTRQPVTKGIIKPTIGVKTSGPTVPELENKPIKTLGRLIHSIENPEMYEDNWAEDGEE